MKCSEVLLKLEDYTYSELSDLESISVAAHLRDCNSCTEKYENILKENEMFMDYIPNIEVNPNLWLGVQERISSLTEISNLANFETVVNNKLTFKQFEVFETLSIWKRLANVFKDTTRDFIANPKLFLKYLFQEESWLARDKNYWRKAKTIALIIWLFSGVSYLGVFKVTSTGFEQKDKLEKIVDISPLYFPPQLIPGQPQVGEENLTHKLEPNINQMSQVSKNNFFPKKGANKIVLPNITTSVDLPSTTTSQDLSFGIPNGDSYGGVESVGSGKTQGNQNVGTGQGQGIGSGVGRGAGYGKGGNNIDESVYSVSDEGVIAPRILVKQKPHYTEEARREKIQGKVILSVVFNKIGVITDIKVISGLGYGLDEEAIKTASQVKFIPATKNGDRISVRARLEFTFNLF